MSNPELAQCVRRELLLLHQSLACNIKHPNICMLGKADSWYRHKISYFLTIVFLDWEKLNQLPHKQTNKNTQWNFFSQCTLSEEMYCVGRTTQGLTGLEIDLTDDWKFNRNTQKQQVRKACCRSVAAELPSTGRHVYSQTVLILISFNLSQFIGWALPRSIIPNRLAKIVPHLGIAFELQLQWSVSQSSEVLQLHVGSNVWDPATRLSLSHMEKGKPAVQFTCCREGNMFLLYGSYCKLSKQSTMRN